MQRQPSRARFPGGESLAEMQARMVAALEAVVADHPGELVVVVSHADPIKAAIAHYTGVHLDLFQRIIVSPASVTVFAFTDHGVAMLKCNDTGSLDELCRPRPPSRQTHPRPTRPRHAQPTVPERRSPPMPDPIELDPVDAARDRARSASPGSAPSTSRRAARPRELTVLVEKEQVALLATEAVAFLDRIADEYPEDADQPRRRARRGLHEPTVPLFRARLIGLGFDPERELVLIELRERSADDEDEDGEPSPTSPT